MNYSNWLYPLACIIPAALVWVTVWGLRRLSVRGFQTAIEMDGITCLKADGSVIFRRSSGYTWLGIMILGVLELALLTFTVLVVTMGNWTLALLVGLLIGCLVIGLIIFLIVRSLRQPYIYVDANSRTLERGTQKFPFSEISDIRATPRTKSVGRTVYDMAGEIIVGSSDLYKTCIDIQAVLSNGGVIELGSVSGDVANSVLLRATAITQLVAEVTGAAIRKPAGNSESIESGRERKPALQPQVTYKSGRMRLILISLILLLLSIVMLLLLPQR
jgi:hypothetical protein